MTEAPTRADEATDRIDQFIKDCTGRSLIDSGEVIDTLLDIRQLIKETPDAPHGGTTPDP